MARRKIAFVGASLLLAATAWSAAWSDEPAQVPSAQRLVPARVKLDATWSTSWSSAEHRLRFMSDDAQLETTLDLAVPESGTVVATPSALALRRTKRAKVNGIFSDSDETARGGIAWTAGQPDAPPSWRLALTPRGTTTDRWALEGWLAGADRRSDEDARLKRLVHSLDFGTLLGAPPLPATPSGRYEAYLPFTAGESGLTNKLVELRLCYDLSVTRKGTVLQVAGPLVRVELVRGVGDGGGPDQWIDRALERRALLSSGELEATFDPARGCFTRASSRVLLEHQGHFSGGAGKARFERRVSFSVLDGK